MRKRVFTEFGRAVANRLMERGMTQDELIAEVKKHSGMFLDSSYLYKLFTGQRSALKIVQAIREILELPEQEEHTA